MAPRLASMGEYYPPVPPHTLCTFEGHVAVYQAGSFMMSFQIATINLRRPVAPTWFGGVRLSLPRALLGRPADRLAERLLARPVPELPALPAVLDVVPVCVFGSRHGRLQQ